MPAVRHFDGWSSDEYGGRGDRLNAEARSYNNLLDRFEKRKGSAEKEGLAERYLSRVNGIIGDNFFRRIVINILSNQKISAAHAVISDSQAQNISHN